jgi:uncharacterized protein (TIGR03083 family)
MTYTPGETVMADRTRTTDASDQLWRTARQVRLQLADDLTGVDEQAFSTPSLCSRWQVREVLAHLVGVAEGVFTPVYFARQILRRGPRPNAILYADAVERARVGDAALLGRLTVAAANRHHPPARSPADVCADAVVHSQDIYRPLGVIRHPDPSELPPLLQATAHSASPLPGKRRARGLRFVATDCEWQTGAGPEVRGPGLALLMAIAGRSVALPELHGPGVETLSPRIRA